MAKRYKSQLARQIRKTGPFQSLEQEAFLNLARTYEKLAGLLHPVFRSKDLSSASYNVLRILRGEGGHGMPCLEIRARLVTPLPDITRLVDGLERRGLVRRKRCEKDRRVIYVEITDEGLDVLASLEAPVLQTHTEQLGHMSRHDLKQLVELLEKARKPVDGDDEAVSCD